jgi:hypothetical protein
VWLCALILSFSYELPLVQLTSFNRLNPRLFDIMSILGLPLLLGKPAAWSQSSSIILRHWTKIVGVFLVCSIFWTFAIEYWNVGRYCLYFGGRYLQGLIVLYCATRVRIDEPRKKTIVRMMIIGGAFVASYAVVEYFRGLQLTAKIVQITGDRVLKVQTGSLFGPLSATYFHIGVFSMLSFAIALGFASQLRTPLKRWMGVALALFVGWPTAFCGSRASLVGALVVVIGIAVNNRIFRRQLIISSIIMGLSIAWFRPHISTEEGIQKSFTIERFLKLEKEGNQNDSIESRFFLSISPADYFYGASLPLLGAGFYVAPVIVEYGARGAFSGDHGETYRIGYGVHNMYLFPLEQGGVLALILFVVFLLSVHRSLKRVCKEASTVTKGLAIGTRAFFYAMLVMGVGGQVFWNYEGNGNLLVYLILTFMISTAIPMSASRLTRPNDRGILEMPQYHTRFAAPESRRAVARR